MKVSEYNAEKSFRDMLDDCYEPIKICGYEYPPSYALKEIDPIAYRQEFLNYADSEGWELE